MVESYGEKIIPETLYFFEHCLHFASQIRFCTSSFHILLIKLILHIKLILGFRIKNPDISDRQTSSSNHCV